MKLTHNELVEIFNNVLNAHPYYPNVFCEMETVCYKETKCVKDYYDKKQLKIEYALTVFENIPKDKIYRVIECFVMKIEKYIATKRFKSEASKRLQSEAYIIRQKDIKIIEAYQEMIYDYTEDNSYNYDSGFAITVPELDDIYQQNKVFLQELETKEYKILNPFRYGGSKLYDGTKKSIKIFFKQLQEQYTLKVYDIKQMVDTL